MNKKKGIVPTLGCCCGMLLWCGNPNKKCHFSCLEAQVQPCGLCAATGVYKQPQNDCFMPQDCPTIYYVSVNSVNIYYVSANCHCISINYY